jgi:hypothetical protein
MFDEKITRCAGCGGWVHVKHDCGTCKVLVKT